MAYIEVNAAGSAALEERMIEPVPLEERKGGPKRSEKIAAEVEEILDFLADEANLPRWWRAPERAREIHLDADPASLRVDLRWGGPGMWRHMAVSVEREGDGSRVVATFLPVPGCAGVCLDREILKVSGALRRLRSLVEGRAHLTGSDGYWL